ncbi:magnesium/cobalt transporter CorA [Halanaerobium praevalens]|uniref:Magnesium transport protein CorA n=1 Tax=Halanaerobium praevalens (strain ATCC 33744 / DSM 2228 / GSL) TaxID=572479 RepID=E3DMM2_HALPG|nr:magnesium/cobalt transporter CorA [Halanaerobium praevalens]ADO76346.1 magnesium and cobalt transport protein CorA [Halanaerobium praevalens DSM 2228]
MRRFSRVKSSEIGHSPGTLNGIEKQVEAKIDLIQFQEDEFKQKSVEKLSLELIDSEFVNWININGIHDVELVKELGELINLHPLTLEDITNTRQRPKKEEFDNYLITILDMLSYKGDYIQSEQVSLILLENTVITFQEAGGDDFENVRTRIAQKKGQIRKKEADYLFYALLDAIVDNYFYILERNEEVLEELDDLVIASQTGPDTLEIIQNLKQEMVFLRKTIWPLSTMFGNLYRVDSPLLKEETDYYLRDVYDHINQLMDEIDFSRDMLASMLDIYLSNKSNKMNEVMQFLTVISTIFIPLTFIAGVYGMNFSYMPELEHEIAYPAIMFLMLVIAVIQLIYFKSKKWL